MNLQKYWNDIAKEKEFTTPFQVDEFSKFVDKNSNILDIGCGYGRTLNELYQLGYRNLIGIDFSEKMIKKGLNRHPFLDLRVKGKEAIEIDDNSVDAVILFAVLTCIITDEEQVRLISEINRVLKDEGVIYVNDFLINDDERNVKRYRKFQDKYSYGVFELPDGGICRHHNKKWVDELLKPFRKEVYGELTFITMNGNKSNGFYYIGSKR